MFVPFYINGTERTCRTKILASPATDTTFHIHNRNLQRIRIICIGRNHRNRSRRTMPGTVATRHLIPKWYAILLYPHGMTNLDGRLLCLVNFQNGSGGTYFGTARTLRTAVAAFVRHVRLHESIQRMRRTEHFVRTSRHAKLAGRAM